MSAVTTTTKYTGKKRYNNYGKYYSYKRIRNLMSIYFRAKLSIVISVEIGQVEQVPGQFYIMRIQNRNGVFANARTVDMAVLYQNCMKYPAYRQLYGYRKIRGVLFESTPSASPQAALIEDAVVIPYSAGVRLAMSESVAFPSWREMADLNMGFNLSPSESIRRYFPLFIKDFSQVRDNDNINTLPWGVPYHLHCNQGGDLVEFQEQISQKWQIRITFYATFRQSVA